MRARPLIILAAGLVLCGSAGLAVVRALRPSTVIAEINTLDSAPNVAIKGYDPVAYFADGKPRRGVASYTSQHNGAKWLFASAANQAAFEKDPTRYVPAYGGYCAYGVAQGYLVKIEPDAWAIRDGRLYLNYDTTVQTQWQKDAGGFIATADSQWRRLTAAH
jgi:YHS domain-containing protein